MYVKHPENRNRVCQEEEKPVAELVIAFSEHGSIGSGGRCCTVRV